MKFKVHHEAKCAGFHYVATETRQRDKINVHKGHNSIIETFRTINAIPKDNFVNAIDFTNFTAHCIHYLLYPRPFDMLIRVFHIYKND